VFFLEFRRSLKNPLKVKIQDGVAAHSGRLAEEFDTAATKQRFWALLRRLRRFGE